MNERGRVGPVARALGFAGLLPQAVAVTAIMVLGTPAPGRLLALGYGALILSFLGGMWWSFAMRRAAAQAALAATAVLPSLVALFIVVGAGSFGGTYRWSLVLLGSAIILTLAVDRHLVRTGEAPEGWMALRVPLSVGLGGLTILAGVLGDV